MQLLSPVRNLISRHAPPAMRVTIGLLLTMAVALPGAQATAIDSYRLGMQYLQQKKKAAALGQFNLAIRQDPNFVDAYAGRAFLYCDIEQEAKALDDCSKVITLDPKNKKYPDIYFYRAKAYKQLDQPEKCLADCNKAFALGSGNKNALYQFRAYAYKNMGKPNEAIQDLTVWLNKSPGAGAAPTYRARAELYEAVNKPDLAIADLNKAIAINPKFDICYQQLARVHENMGQTAKAADDLSALLKINPNDETIYLNRGHLRLKIGRYAEAVADLNKCLEFDPNLSYKAYDYRAEAYTKLGKPDLAAKDRAQSAKLRE